MKISKLFILILAIGLVTVSCKNNPKKSDSKVVNSEEKPAKSAVAPSNANGKFLVDTKNSSIMWTGKKVMGSHSGTIKLSKGVITVANGRIKGGAFEIDMNSIDAKSVQDPGDKSDLEEHLKSSDFFNTAEYPHGYFTITKIEELAQNLQNITHKIYGDLQLKGIKKPIEFNASMAIMDDKIALVTPSFVINRTNWGVNFHSGILGTAKDKIIDDNITLVMDIKANKVK